MKRSIFWTFAITLFILGSVWINAKHNWPGPKQYPSHIHKTLYVDRHFTDDEFILIAWAAIRWSQTTNHIVDYDVVKLPTVIQLEPATPDNAIVVMKMSPDYPAVLALDRFNEGTTLGYYGDAEALPVIAFIEGRFDSPDEFEQVAMHEMGHSVGLAHNFGVDGFLTLMFPSIELAESFITETDLINFCKLYHCNPNKLQHEEEPFHL